MPSPILSQWQFIMPIGVPARSGRVLPMSSVVMALERLVAEAKPGYWLRVLNCTPDEFQAAHDKGIALKSNLVGFVKEMAIIREKKPDGKIFLCAQIEYSVKPDPKWHYLPVTYGTVIDKAVQGDLQFMAVLVFLKPGN